MSVRQVAVGLVGAVVGGGVLALVALAGPQVKLESGFVASWTALVPPIIAVVLTLATRKLLPALGAGVLVGAMLRYGVGADLVVTGGEKYVYDIVFDEWRLYILGFTLTLLGMVQVLARGGGTQGLVDAVARRIQSARGSRLGTAILGLVVFFDDYANCMLVGPAMRPITDRYRVSREKLAYLIDSTAAPVAGLAIVSTWIGHEVGLLEAQSQKLGLAQSGYGLVLQALPVRFYCIFALVLVFTSVLLGRDFGPMLRAERRALNEGKPLREGAKALSQGHGDDHEVAEPRRAINAIVPIVVVVLGSLGGFVVDGGGGPRLAKDPLALFSLEFWRLTLGASENNVKMLLFAALAGSVVAFVLPLAQRLASPLALLKAFGLGMNRGRLAVVVLLLAWGLAEVSRDLGAGEVLKALLGDSLSPNLVPLLAFGLAAAIAYAIGTSWGTMSILIPTIVPLAHGLGEPTLLILSIAAVLDGAIFGDHCSPISDTTLMSSVAAGSDHLDHVLTQLPYAFLAMIVAALCGYLAVARGLPLWASYLIGVGSLWLFLRFAAQKIATPRSGDGPVSDVT